MKIKSAVDVGLALALSAGVAILANPVKAVQQF